MNSFFAGKLSVFFLLESHVRVRRLVVDETVAGGSSSNNNNNSSSSRSQKD